MSEFVEVFIEMDDDTYIYGDNTYTIKKVDGILIEPYILVKDNKIIKYFKSENYFAIYNSDSLLIELVFVSTCWSDDFNAYKINEVGIAYEMTKVYHGRMIKKDENCNIDFNDFIAKNNLK